MKKPGFCRAVGEEVYDIHNQPIVFNGVGIGAWLLIEGYMIESRGPIERPRRFEAHLHQMVGKSKTKQFLAQWRRDFFTPHDVAYLAENGFNMIRIAIDYEVFFEPSETNTTLKMIEENFMLLEDILTACETHHVYVMLDLHAAPGGQTGANIDNSRHDLPELFIHSLYQDQTVFVWETFASRYADRSIIAAYDLLNEPLPEWFHAYNHQLMPFYERLINAIRAVDPHHMITLEGLHWSTDWSCFKTFTDDNLLLQFHKYWSAPDQESIQPFLDGRKQHRFPIIMGEGGENNLPWISAAFKLYAQKNISTVFWTYKKMNATNSIKSFAKPPHWEAFLEGTLNKKESEEVLDILLDNITYQKTTSLKETISAIHNQNSFTLWSHSYDTYGQGVSYGVHQPHQASYRKADGVAIVNAKGDVVTPNFWHQKGESVAENDRLYVRLNAGEWVKYTFHTTSDVRRVLIEAKTLSESSYEIIVNDTLLTKRLNSVFVDQPRRKNELTIRAHTDTFLESLRFTATDEERHFV